MDKGGMSISHDDSPEENTITIVGDGPFESERELEKLARGKNDHFKKYGKEIRKLKGLSTGNKSKITRRINKYASGEDDAKSKSKLEDFVSGYAMFDVAQPPYNLDYLAKIYEISAAHKAAVDAKVTNIVGLGYYFKESLKSEEKLLRLQNKPEKLDKARRLMERAKARLEEWLDDMNSEDVFEEVLRKVWTDYETTGNGYLEVGRKSNGDVGYIGHIPSKTMRRRMSRDGYVQIVGMKVTFFRNFGEDTPDPVGDDPNPNEIIHFRKYSPNDSYYGVPDILAAKNAVAGDEFASRFNLDYFEHKAVPRYIITLKGAKLDAESEKKLVNFLSSNLKGQHHRTIYIPLPGDTQDNKVEFKMEAVEAGEIDASFIKYKEMNRDEILMAHRTPLTKVGQTVGVSLAVARDSGRMFKEEVCRPEQAVIEKKIKPIIDSKTNMFKWKLSELTLTDEETQSKIMERYLRWDVLNPNEVRQTLGKRGYDGGDDTVGVMSQAEAKSGSSTQRDTQSQANRGRRREQDRDNNQPDNPATGETRAPAGEGRQTA